MVATSRMSKESRVVTGTLISRCWYSRWVSASRAPLVVISVSPLSGMKNRASPVRSEIATSWTTARPLSDVRDRLEGDDGAPAGERHHRIGAVVGSDVNQAPSGAKEIGEQAELGL